MQQRRYYMELRHASRRGQMTLNKYQEMLLQMYSEWIYFPSKEKQKFIKELMAFITATTNALPPKMMVFARPTTDHKKYREYVPYMFKFLTSIGISSKRAASGLSKMLDRKSINHEVIFTNTYARATLNRTGLKLYYTTTD